jgi:hypothetical protein
VLDIARTMGKDRAGGVACGLSQEVSARRLSTTPIRCPSFLVRPLVASVKGRGPRSELLAKTRALSRVSRARPVTRRAIVLPVTRAGVSSKSQC